MALATLACVVVWAVARWVVYDFFQIGDTRVYANAARFMDAGLIPFRDFDLEYPPLAALLFWITGRIPGPYDLVFSLAMLACLAAVACAGVVLARRLGLCRARTVAMLAVVALTPLILGTLVQTRYDLLVAALLAWSVVAALGERFTLMWVLAAAAIALKLVPILLVPLLLVWHARRHGRSQAMLAGGVAVGAAALTILPFAVIAPDGIGRMFAYHLDRPAEMGSTASAVVHVLGLPFAHVSSYGSENLVGAAPSAIAAAGTVVLGVLIALIALRTRRLVRTGAEAQVFVAGLVATLAAVMALTKVLSPQYLVWLLPLALVLPGRRGTAVAVATVVAMGATHLNFPLLYDDLVERGDGLAVVALTGRNLLLGLLVWLAWPRSPAARADPGAVPTTALPDSSPGSARSR